MNVTVTGIGAKCLKADVDGRSRFLGVSKPIKLSDFERGKTYDVETKMNGNFENIVAIRKLVTDAPAVAPAAKPSYVPKTETRKERDFDAEARSKTYCAIFCAMVSGYVISNLASTKEAIVEVADYIATEGTKRVFKDR